MVRKSKEKTRESETVMLFYAPKREKKGKENVMTLLMAVRRGFLLLRLGAKVFLLQ